MSLSKKEIDGLMRLISLTKNEEIDCEQCLSTVSEFAELELTGKSPSDALKALNNTYQSVLSVTRSICS